MLVNYFWYASINQYLILIDFKKWEFKFMRIDNFIKFGSSQPLLAENTKAGLPGWPIP